MHRPTINRSSPAKVGTTTTQPVIADGNLNPEFAGHAKIRELFDLSRTHLHRLSTAGKIRSVCLRERGKLRGRRLYDVESVRALLMANLDTEVAN
ncbi:MAG: hypothetical protein WCK17_00215 [Verrucomicrobiota bacterium]